MPRFKMRHWQDFKKLGLSDRLTGVRPKNLVNYINQEEDGLAFSQQELLKNLIYISFMSIAQPRATMGVLEV